MVAMVLDDVRFALRTFRRTPGFALAAIMTTALGVGATTGMFGVVDGVLLRPLPYRGEGMLVQIGLQFGDFTAGSVAPTDYFDLTERSRTLSGVAASRLESRDAVLGDVPERLMAAGVSSTFFDLLGIVPALGRGFRAADDTRNAEAVVVLSHGLWQSRFGGAADVIGRTLTLDEQPHVVAGVLPAGFHGPEALSQRDVQVWFPLGRIADPLDARGDAFLQLIARVRPGQDMHAVRQELRTIGRQLSREFPDAPKQYWVADLREQTIGSSGRLLWVLFSGVALLLLIACANVANLLLVRAADRTREIAVRSALGAGRGRVAGQLLIESATLGLLGGAGGVLLARIGVAVFRAVAPADMPRVAEISVDSRVLGFALVISLLSGMLFGLAPVFVAASGNVAARLREAAQNVSAGVRGQRLRALLVALQTAMAVVLLTAAALLINAFVRLSSVDPGFDVEDVVWMNVQPPSRRYESADARETFLTGVLDQVRALPGVRAAGAIHGAPLDGNNMLSRVVPEGAVAGSDDGQRVLFHSILPGYFEALGIPVLDGRAVLESDRAGSMPVAVVNETFARRLWPAEHAVGKRFRFETSEDASFITVVGVAADSRHYSLGEETEPMMYLPFAQFPRAWVALVVKHDGPPARVMGALRETIWSADPALPLDGGTLRERVSTSLDDARFRTSVLSMFASTALLLMFVGLYGTMAHLVRTRRQEIGIRLALGAATRDVRALIVGRGMRIAAGGILVGTLAAILTMRVLAAFVFDIATTDPATFGAVVAAISAIAFLACWIPARRAAAIDPARTLRSE